MPRRAPHAALAAAALACALAPASRVRAQTHDPRQVFETFETPHFRVHYYQGLRPMAERVAAVGEGTYRRLGALFGRDPDVTEVVVTDNTDDSNGSAFPIPYNTVRIFVTAPEDLSQVGDYDDYLAFLMTHEATHTAQTNNYSGIPAVINAIFGRVYPPNSVAPRWILEGMAVYTETRYTTGGRLRSAYWDMLLRNDALAGNLPTLDQMSNGPNRWPHGTIAYLYGSAFVQYISERYGDRWITDAVTYYGGQLVPFGINRAVRRATGRTYEELYPEFLRELRARAERHRDAIVARGLREGERLTYQNEEVAYPRFLPDGRAVAYQSNDGHSHLQIRTVDAGAPGGPRARPRDGDWIATTSGFAFDSTASRMLLSDTGFYRGVYFYRDLYVRNVRVEPDGALATWDNHALTDGARAIYPDVSPDDDHVAVSINHRGTQSLFEYSLAERGFTERLRVPRYEQVYTPRYSPDGRAIAFSHWRTGGYRDVRVLDRATGEVTDLTHDRHMDMQPVFTPDGRYVVWSSDRTGVFNLYAMERATRRVWQVTNVVGGAFMPAISPDGRTLVYVGYHARGSDLYRMRFDPEAWLEPGPERERGGEAVPTPAVAGRTRPYDPWQTLRPRVWSASLGNDGFGPQVWVSTQGRDVVGNHFFSAAVGVGLTRGDPSFDAVYQYQGMRPTMRIHAYRNVSAANWRVGQSQPVYPADRYGGEVSISVGFPALFVSHALGLTYDAQHVAPLEGLPFGRFVDPNEPASVPPFRGWSAGLRASWNFSRVQRYAYDVSQHEGYEGFVSVHATDRAFGSSFGSFDVSWAASGYLPMPWGQYRRSHVLAGRISGGFGVTEAADRPIFFLGGFESYGPAEFVSTLASLSSGGGVALRGYPPFGRAGNEFYLANVEYRFPIVQIDRGPSTLPIYLSRLYGQAFVDVGHAFFGRFRFQDLAVGVGLELFADVVFGHWLGYTIRGGVARGITGQDAIWQGYTLFSAPF